MKVVKTKMYGNPNDQVLASLKGSDIEKRVPKHVQVIQCTRQYAYEFDLQITSEVK